MRDDPFQPGHLEASAECVWMQAGVVGYKLCDRRFDCERCPFDLAIRDGGHLSVERSAGDSVFYHPSHVWARVEDEGRVRVGMDDFARRLLGRIYAVELPQPGQQAQAGTACWRVSHQAGDTLLLAPVPGIVQQRNPKLIERPSLLSRDPYGDGWAFVVQPAALEQSLKQLYYGARAVSWLADSTAQLQAEASRLLAQSSMDLGPTMTDGGLAVEDLHLSLDAHQLQQLIDSFLTNPAHEAGKAR